MESGVFVWANVLECGLAEDVFIRGRAVWIRNDGLCIVPRQCANGRTFAKNFISKGRFKVKKRKSRVKITVSAVVAFALCVPAMMLGQDNGSAAPTAATTQPAQTPAGAAQQVPGRPAHPQGPAPIQNKILVFQGQQVQTQLAQLVERAKITHHGGAELARSGNIALQLSVMPGNGPGELHRNADDLLIIQSGSATVVTGGTMVNGKDRPGGNTYGSGLEGGDSTPIGAGDIVLIPAGLTHQLLVPQGTVLVMIVGKIQEP